VSGGMGERGRGRKGEWVKGGMGENGIQERKESHGSLKMSFRFINYASLRNAL